MQFLHWPSFTDKVFRFRLWDRDRTHRFINCKFNLKFWCLWASSIYTKRELNKWIIKILRKIKKSMTSQGYSADLDWRHVLGLMPPICLVQGGKPILFFFFSWCNAEQYCRPPLLNRTFSPHLISASMHFSLRNQWCVVSDCVHNCVPLLCCAPSALIKAKRNWGFNGWPMQGKSCI